MSTPYGDNSDGDGNSSNSSIRSTGLIFVLWGASKALSGGRHQSTIGVLSKLDAHTFAQQELTISEVCVYW